MMSISVHCSLISLCPQGLSLDNASVQRTDRVKPAFHTLSITDNVNAVGGKRATILAKSAIPANTAIGGLSGDVLFTFRVAVAKNYKQGDVLLSNIIASDATGAAGEKAVKYELEDAVTTITADPGIITLSPDTARAQVGMNTRIDVAMNNNIKVVGLQADLVVSEDIEVVELIPGDRLTANVSVELNPATGRILISSHTNDVFEGNEGILFSIVVKSDKLMDDGVVELKNVKVSDEEYSFDVDVENTVILKVTEDDPNGISSISAFDKDNVEVYDLSGRQMNGLQKGLNIVKDKKSGRVIKMMH